LVRQGPRVLVTDAEQRSVLATCRGLAAAGYRVSTVSAKRFALVHWSRFPDERITLAGPHADPDGYVQRLSEVLRRDQYDLLIPGSEPSLLPISERRGLIEPYARLGLPPHDVVLRALDKQLLERLAAAAGLAPPKSITCATAEEALAFAPELGFPLVVKPARSVTQTAGQIRQRVAKLVRDATQLAAAVAATGAPLTLQAYARGAGIVSCAAVRVDGELHGLTVARYVRTYPSRIGSAALAVTITPPHPLARQVEELVGLIGWQGLFELELLELGESRFGAIDFNPRPFGWLGLAIGAGANLPALWCDHVLQRRTVSRGAARPGIYYRWEDAEIRSVVAQLRRGRLRSAASVLRPHRRVVHAYFRRDDPGPLVAQMLSMARRFIGNIVRGGARAGATRPASS
jgi:predicted ATP-grasp superfamily ATP-dependent carboligase